MARPRQLMQPLARADDLSALLEVLAGLAEQTGETRAEINQVCDAADTIGGIDEVPTEDLEKQLAVEVEKHRATLALLEGAMTSLDSATTMLRNFSRAEVVQTLDLHQECASELQQWQEKRQGAQVELLELEEKVARIAREIRVATGDLLS